jgi:hypothetical protein
MKMLSVKWKISNLKRQSDAQIVSATKYALDMNIAIKSAKVNMILSETK